MAQCHNVMFTVFATEGEDLLDLDASLWPLCRYAVWQREVCPETGREHFQGYLELAKKQSFALLHDLEGLETAHFEPRRGSQKQAQDYCSKEDTRVEGPWTYGEAKHQGERTDLAAVKQDIDEGASNKDLWQEHHPTMVRYHKAYAVYKRTTAPKRSWAMEIVVYVGPSGTNKSKTAYEAYPDAYWKPKGKWWDGYDGEETVIIDEMYGSSFAYGDLLQLLDRYPYSVETKGGTVEFNSHRIVMTTNQEPEDWYDSEKTHQMSWEESPLYRRLHEFGRIIRTGEVHRRVRPRLNEPELYGAPEREN